MSSEEIKFSNGTTIKLGAEGEPLKGTTPASLDELLKDWEASADADIEYSRDHITSSETRATQSCKRIISLIAVVRKQRDALKEIYASKDSTLLSECCPRDSCLRSNGECCNAQISAHNAFGQSAEKARDALVEAERILNAS